MVVHHSDLSTQEARTVISRLACASKALPQKKREQKTRTPTATTATYWTVLDMEQAEKNLIIRLPQNIQLSPIKDTVKRMTRQSTG